ncbi:MAG: hypothetical protein KDJ77_11480, partial [Rhodobiaceae bacterium]|nr:hypothetical protein [Rhodobiaceae bacterium]
MALTIATFKDQIHDFLQQVQDKAVAEVADSDVPIAGQVAAAAGEFLFQALEDQIFDAVDQAATIADAAALLDAIDGIDAVYSGDGIDLTITAGGGTLDLVSNTQFNLGGEIGGGVGFQVAGDIGAALDAEMTIGLRITEDDVVVADGAGPELSVGLDVDVSLDKTGGSLGFLTIEVSDRDPDAPEVHVGASIDIQSGSISTLASQDWNPVFAGNAGLDLTVDVIGQEFLPSMTMNLVMGYDLTGVTSPTIAFNDISIDVASMFGVFAEVLVEMADILDTEPLGTLLDIMTGPVPLIDDLAHGVPGLAPGVLDPIPSLLPDGIVSLVDLAAVKDSIQGNEANKFYDVLGMLGFVRSIGQQIGSAGSINLGDLDFSQGLAAGGADAFLDAFQATTGIDFVQTFNDIIGSNPVFEQISDELRDSFTSNSGLEIPILDDPTLIVQFLFNEIFGDVDIVRFDLPDLDFEAEAELFFSILGPLGLVLGGEVNGHLDMTVGYDTAGLSAALQGGDLAENLLKGIYFTTKQNTDPIDPDSNPTGFDAVAHVDGRISAGAALRAVVVNASITGGIGFGTPERGIDGWFNVESDGKLRLADLDGCFIDVSGTAVADVQVEIEIGFDPFSFTERIPLVSTVLADFDIVDCLTDVTSPDGQGLATFAPAGFGVHDLVLNTGDRASQRVFEGGGTTSVGTDVAENYEIRFARDVVSGGPTPGTTVYGPPMLDTLDLTAFGITKRYGVDTTDSIDDADQRIFAIRANLGEGNDSVVLEKEIGIFAFIDGGAGNDLIVGGAGNDELDGGEGDDFLIGNGGDDTLTGGNGNDQLEGGAGADMLDGGAGRDKVSYYDAATEAVQILADAGGQLVGVAGDAVGDTFVSIEYFVGTRFNDTLTSAQDASDQDTATLEGREGDDLLLGSDNKKDFLIGGAGADTMVGGDLEDGTTYLSSYGAVTIDLQNHIYYGGDANGDVLDSIEDVQGSAFDDFIVGDSGNNVIDGFIGDDVLTGFLGQDRVLGGAGNDTVYAYADGDLLDGGGLLNDPGRDLLTYELANTPGVTVNLATKVGGGGDVVAAAQRITGEDPTTHAPVFAEAVGYSTFENLTGSQGSDNLTGDNQANVIRGLAGNDTISGGGGNDILIGGAGADHFSGGAGFDWVDYSEATGAVDVSLFEGDVSHGAEAEGDTFTNPGGFGDFADVLENLRGSRFSDDLSGDNRDNIIDPGLSDSGATGDFVNGQGGNDTLWLDYSVGVQGKGLVGGYDSGKADQGTFSRQAATTTDVIDSVRFFGIENLYVIGTASNDKVYGASGNDVVITGDGDDTILGGTGMDALFAGSGNDTVEYGTGLNRQTLATHNPTFFQLDGGDGIDTLNLHLGGMTTGVTIVGPADGAEWNGHNLLFANGASAHNFEILADIDTGSGNDYLEQQGRANNNWFTSVGIDTIKPGLGSDFVNAGVETDGLSFGTNDEGRYIAQVVDAAAYYGSPGDLLVLDYSSLAAGQHVESDSSLVDTDITIGRHHFINEIEEVWDYWSVQGNSGYYRTLNTDGSPVGDSIISIFHDRVDITGSDGDDVLLGSWVPYDSFLGASAKGDDVLHGGKGNDAL